jgi:hypothetical protein
VLGVTANDPPIVFDARLGGSPDLWRRDAGRPTRLTVRVIVTRRSFWVRVVLLLALVAIVLARLFLAGHAAR